MAILRAPLGFKAKFETDAEKARRVTADDAAAMRSEPRTWFEVVHGTKSLTNTYGVAKALRANLSTWYGGIWQATLEGGKVYVRFVAEIAPGEGNSAITPPS